MEVNQDIMDLICKLEYCIGDTCCNIHSYNGWTNEWGTDFRYPVVASNEGRYYGHLEELGLKPGSLAKIYYVFGANRMHIGYGIKHVLEELEDLYGLDFVKLEAERKAKVQK